MVSIDVDVTDARSNFEGQIYAMARDLVAHYMELQRMVDAFPCYGDQDLRTHRPLQQVGYLRARQVVYRLAINGEDGIAGTYSGFKSRRIAKWSDHNDLILPDDDFHA